MNILEFIERHKVSILLTAILHMFLFAWFNVQVIIHKPYKAKERVVMQLDFSEEPQQEENQEAISSETASLNTQNISNVVQNASQEKTTYTNERFDKAKAEQEVWEELKAMEAAEFNSIKHEEEDETVVKDEKYDEIDHNLIKKDAVRNDKATYGMDITATATYFLKDRTPQRKPTPSYKCTSEGVVTVIIKVNQKGRVVSSSIDEHKTNTTDECLRNEAINYAKRWRFTQNFNDPLRKEGWIKFTYVSQ